MKKILFIVVFMLCHSFLYAQFINTPNVSLELPNAGSTNWNIPLNYNFNKLDQILGGTLKLPGVGLELKAIFGSGSPTVTCNSNNQSQQYFDIGTLPFTGYICNGSVWSQTGAAPNSGPFPSGIVYGLTATTARSAVASDIATLLSGLSGCTSANTLYSPGNGNCILAVLSYPGAGVPLSTGTGWGTSYAAPAGALVGTTDTQTLTNKTLSSPVLSGTVSGAGTVPNVVLVNSATTVNGQTCTLGGTCTVPSSMVYPGTGVAVSTGSAWGTSLNTIGTGSVVLASSTSTTVNGQTCALGGTCAISETMVYPGAGIPNSTGSAWGTSYNTTGSGLVTLATSPTVSSLNATGITTTTNSTSSGAVLSVQSTNSSNGTAALQVIQSSSGSSLFPVQVQDSNNTTSGNETGISVGIGSASSTNNAATLEYTYSGTSGSTSNYTSLGLAGNPHLLNVFGTGEVSIGSNSPTGHLLSVTTSLLGSSLVPLVITSPNSTTNGNSISLYLGTDISNTNHYVALTEYYNSIAGGNNFSLGFASSNPEILTATAGPGGTTTLSYNGATGCSSYGSGYTCIGQNAAGIILNGTSVSLNHITGSGSTPSLIFLTSGCGAGSPSISGTDTNGKITATFNGSTCTAGALQITFASSWATAPRCFLQALNSSSFSWMPGPVTTTTLELVSQTNPSSITYSWYYMCSR